MPFSQLDLCKDSANICQPIALWKFRANEITSRFGIHFVQEDMKDGLGVFDAALIEAAGRRFVLVDHLHSPNPGTEVCTDEHSADFSQDLSSFLSSMGIGMDELKWTHPNIQ